MRCASSALQACVGIERTNPAVRHQCQALSAHYLSLLFGSMGAATGLRANRMELNRCLCRYLVGCYACSSTRDIATARRLRRRLRPTTRTSTRRSRSLAPPRPAARKSEASCFRLQKSWHGPTCKRLLRVFDSYYSLLSSLLMVHVLFSSASAHRPLLTCVSRLSAYCVVFVPLSCEFL